ncbi:VapE domain-containing protein [Sphingobacterium humi]|uniref:Virulence protein E n=1 Tax=Sphingobacterium humi TaxID=1796905 RepID=A0A6N8L6X9_9SPHI|nr:VapE domain-containing protein [Sphingobacterium humi]MVZ63492.1 virulence protein E [Sphingobacterium humi]
MKQRDDAPSIQKVVEYLTSTYDFRKNTLTNAVEYKAKLSDTFKEVNENNLYLDLRINVGLKATISDILVFLGSDYVSEYDPILEYFNSIKEKYQPFLHGDYISKFVSYVSAKEQTRFEVQFKKWMVRTILCAIREDYFNKQAFILVCNKQSNGKTTFTRFLVPEKLRSYSVENIGIDKDSIIALSSNFICILDELASLTKFEINSLKSIMSKLHINVRHPYDRKARTSPRRISFIGSTNLSEFLTDDANVRWVCFEIQDINWQYKDEIDIDLLWSHAYYLLNSGFKYEMSRQEIEENEIANEGFKVTSIEYELLQKYFSPGSPDKYDRQLMSSEIFHEIQLKSYPKLNQKEFARAMKRLGFSPYQIRGHVTSTGERSTYPVKVYYVVENS